MDCGTKSLSIHRLYVLELKRFYRYPHNDKTFDWPALARRDGVSDTGDYSLRELNNKHYIFKTSLPWCEVIVKSYYRFNIKQAGAMRFNFCMPGLGQGSGPGIYKIFFCLACLSR